MQDEEKDAGTLRNAKGEWRGYIFEFDGQFYASVHAYSEAEEAVVEVSRFSYPSMTEVMEYLPYATPERLTVVLDGDNMFGTGADKYVFKGSEPLEAIKRAFLGLPPFDDWYLDEVQEPTEALRNRVREREELLMKYASDRCPEA